MSVVVVETGTRTLAQYLRQITERLLQQRAQLLDEIGRRVALSVRANFQQSRSPEGERWPPLVREPGRRPLIKTGALLGSVDHSTHSDYVAIGYRMEYGRFHQEGTRWIPMRRFLGLRDTDDEMIREQVGKYAREAFA